MRHLFPLVGLLFAVGTAAHGAVVTWDGGGNGQLASTPANWAGDHAPQPGDAIVLDGTCGKDVTWDLAIPVAGWTQTAAYAGTVIIRTTYDESFPALLIAGDCVVAGGRMGHPSNSGVPQWRLSLQVGGSLTLGSGAIIDVVGAGFTRHSGPGAGTAGNGGSHGGMGGRRSDTREVCTYGSFNEPTTLGSAGWEMGGGAVRLVVAGAARIDGVVNADGWAWYGQNSGAGGSIWITAGRVMGTGSIHANGGSPWEWNTGGGGGRVAITCTEPGAVVSGFAGIVQAVGGFCCDGQSGAAGTVYLRDAGQGLNQGTLIIANQGITDADVVSEIPAGQSWQLRRLVLRDGGRLGLPTGTSLTVAPDTIIAPVQGNGGIRLGGGTLTVDGGLLTVANWRLVVDAPTTLNASLVVGMNGLVTHSGNHRWGRALPGLPQDGLGLYRCALTVTGDCTITNAGSISADGCGYGYNQGPGAIPAGNRGGGSHGGAGADYGDSHSAHPTYGVISAPVTLGSGGSWLAGGGAIRLTVGGTTRIDGRLSANGSLWYGNDGGSGGSVWLTTASLTGTGVIQANGGGPSNGEWAASGGGGRVAVQVTGPAGFDAWAGGMSAVSPSAWATGAPGTVYTRAGTVGDLLVDNRGVEPTQSTVVPDDGSAVRHVTISGRARMVMPNRTMSGNMLVGEASAVSLPDGLTVAGSLVNFGNVSTSTGTVAISGDWSNHGTYAAGTATVVLAGSQPVVTGSSTFWNLVKDGGQATVTFTAGSTQTITNNLTLRGSDQGQLRLRSTQPGTAWFINPQAGRSTGWLSIQDSHNVNALDVDAGEGSSNAGNARKWNFFASVAPTIAVAASASPNPTDTGVSALSVLGADDGGEPSLIYTWSVASGPGAAQFTNNGTHAAANSIATFGAVGTYALVATIEDGRAQTATSAVTVAVTSIPSGQGQGTGLCGYYFPNTTFSGLSPGVIDPTVNFVWNGASPVAGVPGEYFSVRWLGQIQPQFTEDLTLVLRTDDGVRVWLDGQMVINDWFGRGATDSRYTFPAQAGRRYDLRIDYYQGLGGAAAQLYWESGRLGRQIVPQSQLYPLETDVLTARLPKTSVVSPVCIEGQHGPGATLVGKVNGHVVHLSDLPDTAWFANVPLDDHAAVAVEAGASHGDIAWTPTDLSKEAKLTVRVNDAVLLRAPVALSYRVQVNCGVLGAEIAMSASSQHVYQFTQPGIYHLVSVNELGVTIGDVQVTVIGIDLDGPIACQVGYRREKGVDIVGGAVDQVVFTAADAGQLAVTVKESTPYGARLYLRPDRRGTPMLLARLASSRAIIAAQVIDEYTIETNALLHTVRNSKTGNGGATAVLRPWIPDLTGQFRLYRESRGYDSQPSLASSEE